MKEPDIIAENAAIAGRLRRAADLLEQQDATPYRAQAFRRAAATLAGLDASVVDIVERVGAPPAPAPAEEPPAAMILDVDHEYRARAEAGSLPRITPQRFTPTRAPWLPILHTARGRWRFTALWSNTRQAHELGKSHDGVVIYFHNGDHRERQRTVVTETHGELEGRRVVRGREAECREEPRAA